MVKSEKVKFSVSKVVTIIMIIIVVLISLLAVFTFMLTANTIGNKFSDVENKMTLPKNIISASLLGEEFQMSYSDLNNTIGFALSESENSSSVKNLYLEQNEKTTVYSVVNLWGRDFCVKANCNITAKDQNVSIEIEKLFVGKISLPPDFCLDFLKNKVSENIKINHNFILIDCSEFPFKIDSINFENDGVKIKPKSVIDDYINNQTSKDTLGDIANKIDTQKLSELIPENLIDNIEDKLGELKNKYGDLIEKFLK